MRFWGEDRPVRRLQPHEMHVPLGAIPYGVALWVLVLWLVLR